MPPERISEGPRRRRESPPGAVRTSSSRRDGSPSTADRRTLGEKVDPATHAIVVDGRAAARHRAATVHVVLHKPPGVTSTARDRHAARTVVELIPRELGG